MSVLPPLEEKASYVEQMFSRIAHGYDRANRVMTLGMDRSWRRRVIERTAPVTDGRALDVGTGTGDFLPLLAEWMPRGMAVGVDFCLPMMQEGRSKLDQLRVGAGAFVSGDALRLPFADDSFDVITTGFAMRNVTNIKAAFAEMWRVARRGGMVGCLEVAQPRQALLRLGHRLYFEGVVPWLGALLSGDRKAYTYLPQSARAFPPPAVLADMMREVGWKHVHYRFLSLGAVAIHTGVKL